MTLKFSPVFSEYNEIFSGKIQNQLYKSIQLYLANVLCFKKQKKCFRMKEVKSFFILLQHVLMSVHLMLHSDFHNLNSYPHPQVQV